MNNNETKRLSRLIAILTQLQTKRRLTAVELANRFSVSVRTIYRDMKSLEQAGVPIATEEGKGYNLLEGYRLPPIMFTEDEANAIVTAGQLIAQNKDASFVRDYAEAVNKIKAVLRYNTREKANLLADRMKFYQNPQLERSSDYLSILQKALTNFNPVKIAYLSLGNERSVRVVEPFALLNTQENWLLVGWCHLRNAYRIFRLDRIETMTVLPETFEPHKLTLADYFSSLEK
ncbi:helix-turn-helix transcriptional regulator [Fibrisoma limi]|nr:YafY family protein [Fibrisoma limi]